MRTRWWISLAIAATCATGATVALAGGVADAAAATKTYTRVVVGTDFHSLEIRIGVQLLPNTGGGAFAQFVNDGSSTIPTTYLETPLDLPVGAKLTSVTFYFRDCGTFPVGGDGFPDALFYVGSYTPATGDLVYVEPEATNHWGDCNARYQFTRTGSPIATVAVGERYVLGVDVINDGVEISVPPGTNPTAAIYGARVRYTCDATCR